MTTVLTPALDLATAAPVPSSLRGGWRRIVRRHPFAAIAAAYLLVLFVVAVAAPLVAPHDPGTQNLSAVLRGPGAEYWLGTDRLGRDVFSRLLFGARVTLVDVAVATSVFLAVGLPLGIVAGYRGGWLDRVVGRVADLVLAVPAIVVLLMIVAVFPGNDLATMVTLGVIGSPGLLRIVRGSTLALRGELYVTAARLSGLRTPAILRRHILPRLAGPIIVQLSLFAATALLAESGLSFLGLSRPETQGPSWGNMVAEASVAMARSPWLLVPTGAALMLTVMAFSLVGDAVRDATVGRSTMVPVAARRRSSRAASPPIEDTASVLSVRGLTVTLPTSHDPVTVVRDIGFDIRPGEAFGIVGESGCGKSITAKALLGLLPPGGAVTGGAVIFDGADVAGLDEKAMGRLRGSGIALISQDPMNSLDPTFTVASQLREVIRRHRGLNRRDADAHALELLRMVNLPDPADVLRRRAAELSGGMAQRVAIALALAGQPRLLIADEPTTALDVTVQAEILALLRGLQRRVGMAVLLITHDWGVLADMCDRAAVMYAGEIVETAPVEQLYAAPRHPYTKALVAANPHVAPLDAPLPAIPGSVPPPGAWPDGCHYRPRCPLATTECAGTIPLLVLPGGRATRCVHDEEVASA
jgi:peptide/nickel transport system permease protein